MKRILRYLYIALTLLLLGIGTHIIFEYGINREKLYTRKVSGRLNTILQEIDKSHEQIRNYILNNNTLRFEDLNDFTDTPTYIYEGDNLVYWSVNTFTPQDTLPQGEGNYQFIETENRKYVIVQHAVEADSSTYKIYSLVPLFINYDINNEFLQSGYNTEIFESSEVILHKEGNFHPVRAPDGGVLFQVEFLNGYVIGLHWLPFLIFLLISTGFILIIYILYRISGIVADNKGLLYGILLLFGSVFFIRLVILWMNFPFNYLNFSFFDPKYYASSYLNPSLGDLFINVVLIFIISNFIFKHYIHRDVIRFLKTGSRRKQYIDGFIFSFLDLFLILLIYRVIYSLCTHSQWSMDISSDIRFTAFRWISYLLYIIVVYVFLQLTYLFNKFLLKIFINRLGTLFILFVIAYLIFTGVGLLMDNDLFIIGLLSGIFLFLSYYIDIRTILIRFQYKSFVYILMAFIIVSLTGAVAINNVKRKQDQIRVERFGEQLVQENDPLAEYFLAEATQQIRNDIFIKNRLPSPFGSKEIIEEKIRRIHLNNYLEKFEINVLLFNRWGDPITPGIKANYHKIYEDLARPQYQTEYKNLYFYFLEPTLRKRYLDFIPITQYNTVSGYIILDLRLKRIVPTKVYPRLLLDDRFSGAYFQDQYDYALYKDGKLINSSGNFNYERNFNTGLLENQHLFGRGIRVDDYVHYGFQANNNKIYVISKQANLWIDFFADFSFLFLLLSFCFLITLVLFAIYFNLKGIELNYVTRIQLYLNLAFFIPLIVISISTLTKTSSDYKKDLDAEYLRTAEQTSNNLTGYLQSYIQNNSSIEELSSKLSELADFSELDMNIFRILQNQGRLIVSTQPLIYDKDILAQLVNPQALARIREEGEKSIILNETFGKLDYKTAYVGIRSSTNGALIGILSIPFFASQEVIESNLSGLVVNILSIFTIIFISFIALSYIVSNYLTFPLKFLTDKLRRTTLTGINQPIQYHSHDEIGTMVEEYNNMLLKLEQSKKALAQTEKEAAWREMAKQVAHEIKNPLTPMKLTLQHMKMRINDRQENGDENLNKSIDSLLHNIQTLSDIATSFSNYAQMPMPERERFDIIGLLRQTINIYIDNEDKTRILADIPDSEVIVEGDPGWIGRTISNLIINGIQAVKNKDPEIKIDLKVIDGARVLIQIKDNGEGIPDEIRGKIFLPNFSTKYSGSGIGLAIAKRAVDHAGGKIWFESVTGLGTTFYLELPVVG